MDPKDQNKSENTEAAKNSTVGNVKQEKLKRHMNKILVKKRLRRCRQKNYERS